MFTAEGLSATCPVFSEFLNVAALSDGELVSFSTIARECASPAMPSRLLRHPGGHAARTVAARLHAAAEAAGHRAPKFYFADVGVVNHLARRGELRPGSELYGKAFENWVFHELRAHNAYREAFAHLAYWRLASGIEVDFVVDGLKAHRATARPFQ